MPDPNFDPRELSEVIIPWTLAALAIAALAALGAAFAAGYYWRTLP